MGSKTTIRYHFDESNRLVITQGQGMGDRLRTVRVVEGTVTTDHHNRLVYRIDTQAETNGHPGPHRYHLDGTWALGGDHRLKLTLHERNRRRRQTLYLSGTMIEAKARALTFALRRHEVDGRRTVQRLSLKGRWQADRRNRLTFLVEKADGSQDRLTFQGGWAAGASNALRYRYRQQTGTSRRRSLHTLRYAGFWEINRANRLMYRLETSTDSSFDFRASVQRPSLNAREGRLVYQVGIGLSRHRTRTQRVVLFGTWKLSRDLAVSFEVPYANGRRSTMRFHATWALTTRDTVAVRLLDRRGRPLGIAVTFSRKFLNDAQLFVRLRRAESSAEVLAGVQVRF